MGLTTLSAPPLPPSAANHSGTIRRESACDGEPGAFDHEAAGGADRNYPQVKNRLDQHIRETEGQIARRDDLLFASLKEMGQTTKV